MKALLLFIFISVVASCQEGINMPGGMRLRTEVRYHEPNDGTTGDSAYFYGNSITYGLNASPRTTARWSTLLSSNSGLLESNNGISGTTLVPNSCWISFDTSTIAHKTSNGRFLFISYGVNDAFNTEITPTSYKLYMGYAIQAAINRGWTPGRIIVNSLFYTTRTAASMTGPCTQLPTPESGKALYVQAAKEAAAEKGAWFIDTFNYMKNYGGLVDSDSVHPTTLGHSVIAGFIKSQLRL